MRSETRCKSTLTCVLDLAFCSFFKAFNWDESSAPGLWLITTISLRKKTFVALNVSNYSIENKRRQQSVETSWLLLKHVFAMHSEHDDTTVIPEHFSSVEFSTPTFCLLTLSVLTQQATQTWIEATEGTDSVPVDQKLIFNRWVIVKLSTTLDIFNLQSVHSPSTTSGLNVLTQFMLSCWRKQISAPLIFINYNFCNRSRSHEKHAFLQSSQFTFLRSPPTPTPFTQLSLIACH